MSEEITACRDVTTSRGMELGVTSFSSSDVLITCHPRGLTLDIHLTREEALQLSKNLEDVVAAYDATVDRFHEVCDEPVAAEVH